jgi:hypothetical protein
MTYAGQAAQSLNDYRLEMDRAAPGLLMDSNPFEELSFLNSGAQSGQTIQDIAVGGTIAAGNKFTVLIAVTTAIGTDVTRALVYTAVAGNTATVVAENLRDLINDDELINDYLIATNVAGVLKLAVRQGRKIKTITAAAEGAATITSAPSITEAAGPSIIKWGYFVGQYPTFGDRQCGAITTNVGCEVLGICKLYHRQAREEPFDPQREFGILPFGDTLALTKARVWVPVFGTVARHERAAYLNATGQPCREGTPNSTPVPGVKFVTASGTDGLAGLALNLPV